jgi:hypothetical protein
LAAQPLAKRMLGDQPLQIWGDLFVLAELQQGVDPLLDDGLPQLVEPLELDRQRRLVRKVCERGATPQSERLAELRAALLCRKRSSFCDETLEAAQVDRIGISTEHVSPRLGDNNVLAEALAQPRNVVVERGGCVRRLLIAPQLVDQPVGANDLVRLEHEQRKHGAALRAPQVEGPTISLHLERPEYSKFHLALTVTPSSAP